MLERQVKLTFVTPVVGTVPLDEEVARSWVMDQIDDAKADEEAETIPDLDEELEKMATGFHRNDDGQPCQYDYQVKGFLKEACSFLRRVDDTVSAGISAYRKKIKGLWFVYPRLIPYESVGPEHLTIHERPLRASGPQGERTALARSEMLPPGAQLTVTIKCLDGDEENEELLEEWLDYGEMMGLGQRRGDGFGRFTWEPVDG